MTTKVLNLRLGEKLPSCKFDFNKLYYLSTHILNGDAVKNYGKARLQQEATEAWITKRLIYAGITYDDSKVSLNDAELDLIPGSKILSSVDALKFEICVRNGTNIDVHPDECRYWDAQDLEFSSKFLVLKKEHDQKWRSLLANIIGNTLSDPAEEDGPAGESDVSSHQLLQVSVDKPQEFESEAALNAADPIKDRAISEEADIEMLLGTSGCTYLLSKKGKSLAKFTSLAGYGTGKYFSADTAEAGVPLDFEAGDQTWIQVDTNGINPDTTAIETQTVYKYLVSLEKMKKVTDYKMSYLKLKRKDGAGADVDGFTVEIEKNMKYSSVQIGKLSTSTSCKSWYRTNGPAYEKSVGSKFMLPIFRWKFERVHSMSKIQKPYMITKVAMTLPAGKPVKARWDNIHNT
jgi:hypothetical protein